MKIGNYIRNYRKSIGLSMDKFCKNICSVKQLERIEKNISEPSISFLNSISRTYNINFYQYYKNLTYFKDNNNRKMCDNILHLIKTYHIEDIIPLCNELDNNPDFDSGVLYTFKCYAKAILTNYKDKYKETILICYKGLKKEVEQSVITSIVQLLLWRRYCFYT